MKTSIEMPRYQSHKKVWALRISAVEISEDGSATIMPEETDYGPLHTKPGWGATFKGSEDDPGVYVRYEDGYESWSPSAAFDAGYSRI